MGGFRYLITYSIILTITLYFGGWWALQEGSWGGWWNWDASEVLGLITLLYLILAVHGFGDSEAEELLAFHVASGTLLLASEVSVLVDAQNFEPETSKVPGSFRANKA